MSIGGKLAYIYKDKKAAKPKCGDCKCALNGVPALRPTKYAGLAKNKKTINRAYGGSRCATCVRNRYTLPIILELFYSSLSCIVLSVLSLLRNRRSSRRS